MQGCVLYCFEIAWLWSWKRQSNQSIYQRLLFYVSWHATHITHHKQQLFSGLSTINQNVSFWAFTFRKRRKTQRNKWKRHSLFLSIVWFGNGRAFGAGQNVRKTLETSLLNHCAPSTMKNRLTSRVLIHSSFSFIAFRLSVIPTPDLRPFSASRRLKALNFDTILSSRRRWKSKQLN